MTGIPAPRRHFSCDGHAMRLALALLLLSGAAHAQPTPPSRIVVKAARMFDGTGDRLRTDVAVLIEGNTIKEVGTPAQIEAKAPGARVIDVGQATLLPGLVDAHTHLASDGVTEDYATMLIKQSLATRAIVATANARTMLAYGFTTVRDVETEGAMYTDADLAAAIASGLVPGPRLYASTRGIAPTGGYLPDDVAWDAKVATGAQLVDGVDEIRKAVREQVRFGASWIKVYADFGMYPGSRADRPLRSRPNFRDDELRALVDEAHRLGRKVAAHATGWEGIDAALRAGVDSIEHGFGLTTDLATRMAKQGVALVPTTHVMQSRLAQAKNNPRLARLVEAHKAAVKRALAAGVRIVNGSDVGSFPYTDNPVAEIALLHEYGLTRAQALRAATSAASPLLAPLCAPDQANCEHDKIGVIAPGAFADLIAVDGNPLDDLRVLASLKLVMKDGVVVSP